jgi:tetratricopeptide (TPR) repeat protein
MPSIRDLRDAKRRTSFTGRKVELNTFRQLLLTDRPEYALLHIYGVGGVGKSSLLGQYRRIAQELGYPVGQVDLQVNFGVVEILRTLRAQFESRYFPEFDKALATYNQVEGRLQSTAGSLSSGFISGLREGVPFGLGALAVDTVGEERIKNWLYQHLPQQNADLYLHADRILTTRFVEGLNDLVAKTGKVVILFDTYELSSKSQDAWLREIFLDSDLSADVLVVIAGRDQLSGLWHEWSSVLLSLELAPFSDAEAREYLSRRGINAPHLVDALIALTGRFPWSLALFTDTPAIQDMGVDELERAAAVRGLSDMLVDRFLSQVYDDVEMRELVYLCAVPRNFDFDVIRALWGRQDVAEALDRLRHFSFVRVRGDGRWSIHNVVRLAINERLRSQTPQRWRELNEAAVGFYRQRAEDWPPYSDEWRWLTLERLYHQIQVREDEGIQLFTQLFETAKRFLHYDFCSELLSTFDEIELQRPASERWIAFYHGKMARLADSTAWDHAHAVNRSLYELADLEPALRARVTTDLGRYYYHISCQYLEAVAALEESLALRRQLDGDLGEAYVLSHLAPAYAAASLPAQANAAGERCVALSRRVNDPYREGWGHYSLGESAGRAGDWAAALGHLERASALFQSLDAEFELGVVLRRAGRAHLHLGQWEPALANFESNLALMRRYDKHAWALRALVDLCETYLASGDLDALRPAADEARSILVRYAYPDQEARLYLTEAEAALLADHDGAQAALSYVDALLALVRAHGCVTEEIIGRYQARMAQLEAGGDQELATSIANRVQGDIEAALAGQLVRGGSLVAVGDEVALARLRELQAVL